MNFPNHCQKETIINKSDLIPSVAHELKNPLCSIISIIELLREEISNPSKECLEYLQYLQTTAGEMNELVHDLLDANSKNEEVFSIDLSKEIKISDVIKRSIKINRDYAIRRRIELVTEISDPEIKAKLDGKRMRQILSNLISNAIKYSTEQSKITITCLTEESFKQKTLIISVKDQGFGMTPIQLIEAFMKYKTIKNPNSSTVDSFGMGLPIVKELVEAQNGSLKINSILNKGTEAIIKFPI